MGNCHRLRPSASHYRIHQTIIAKPKLLDTVAILSPLTPDRLLQVESEMTLPIGLIGFTSVVKAEDWETKVLRAFLEDDRITAMPSSRKKRLVILKWLVRKFDCDRDYPEKELNTIIQQHHSDSATLHQEFIGYNLMTRANTIYHRQPKTSWESTEFN